MAMKHVCAILRTELYARVFSVTSGEASFRSIGYAARSVVHTGVEVIVVYTVLLRQYTSL
ncbi:hypothetical protein JI435_419480 [Parastagonospora nodorum SN15]|uniref:Uncharacterized protein n=1 Tax=Phaeosphaeria nodorum (strain SN15 / ATCC MYA-4574 / FGSC 10173) TaxID=321614 RepID=A0A7U2I812_PHANO|nr:hypothetical protein JI435_419480 [Parastagonospora nodorum SN15]